jgi:hypothetical protein
LIVASEKNFLTDDSEVIAEHGSSFLAMRRQEPVATKRLCSVDICTGALLLEGKYIMLLRGPAFCAGFLFWNLTCVKYLSARIS